MITRKQCDVLMRSIEAVLVNSISPEASQAKAESSTAVQRDLDMAAVYAESLKAIREAGRGVGGSAQIEIANLLLLLKAAKHLLLAAKGPRGGPTCWHETRRRWMEEYESAKP